MNKPPEAPKKRSNAKRPKHQETADHNQNGADQLHSETDQNPPAAQVEESANRSNLHADGSKPQGAGPDAELQPLERFTQTLSRATMILAVATVFLAAATIALVKATWSISTETEGVKTATQKLNDTTGGLVAATQKLAGATDKLVDYAKQQSADMKESIDAARDSASAAKTTASATNKTVDIMREQLNRGRANIYAEDAEIKGSDLSNWRDKPIEATVYLDDTGDVPGQGVEIVAKVSVARVRSPPCDAEGGQHFIQASIGPGSPYNISVKAGRLMTFDEVQKIRAGTSAIFVYGRMTYKDGSPVKRWRTFRLSYDGDVPDGGFFAGTPPDTYSLAHTSGCNDGN